MEKRKIMICSDLMTEHQERLPMMFRDMIPALLDINEAVVAFCEQMITKLTNKAIQGVSGWNDTSDSDLRADLLDALDEHIKKAQARGWGPLDCVDIANYCMMISRLPVPELE